MAKIQSKYKNKFNPFFTTRINGVVSRVNLKDFESNPRKYINTALGYMYEGYEKLKEDIKKRTPDQGFENLNMALSHKGDLFDKNKRELEKEKLQADFFQKQAKSRARLEKLAKANLAKKQLSSTSNADLDSAKEKAVRKKTTPKKKSE